MLFQKNEPFKIFTRRSAAGLAMGRLTRGRLLYFGTPLTRYHIALRRARGWLARFEVLGALIFALGFFGFSAWQLRATPLAEIFSTRFWRAGTLEDSTGQALFWLGVISVCFLIYRLMSAITARALVETKGYGPEAGANDNQTVENAEEAWRLPRSKRKDIAAALTAEGLEAIEAAYLTADARHNEAAAPLHLFYALLKSVPIRGIFIRLGVPVKHLESFVGEAIPQGQAKSEPAISPDLMQVLFHAYEYAREARQEYVHVTELLLAAVRQSEAIQELLYDLKVDGEKLSSAIEWVRVGERLRRRRERLRRAAAQVSKHGIDRAMTAVATPYLNSFSQDLTMAAKYGYLAPCVARDKEIAEIFRVIEGGRQSVVLVGEHGVGKMSIIEGVVQRMIEGNAPQRLQEKRFVQLSTSALLAGTTVSGAQERLMRMVGEVRRARNIVLFINNIQDLVGLRQEGGQEGLDVSGTLAEFMQQGGVLTFATSIPDGYNRHIQNSQLSTVFTRIDVPEMSENQAIQVLESKAGQVEYKHNVFFSYEAIEAAVKYAKRFLHDQRLPESALELMSEAASLTKSKSGENAIVTGEAVAAVITDKTGIPATSIAEDESAKLLRLEEEMHQRVIGQSEAVTLVANALRRARAEIRSTKRPIANFLFLGPAGVGKTELAKAIAAVYFGGGDRMGRLDMSEFQDKAGVYRLIGSPGQQGTGLLTEAVRQRPFSLVLLDELEKADPDVVNLFLQVFDDGRLTDSVGRVIDFTNTIIIATSNAGTAYVQEQTAQGLSTDKIRQALIRGELKKYYRPELLNRFDAIVLFTSLSRDEIKQVAKLMLKRVGSDLEQRGVALRVEDAALEALSVAGFDPEFGARPMRRAIQEQVENKLAELILGDQLKRRDTVVIGEGAEIRVERN